MRPQLYPSHRHHKYRPLYQYRPARQHFFATKKKQHVTQWYTLYNQWCTDLLCRYISPPVTSHLVLYVPRYLTFYPPRITFISNRILSWLRSYGTCTYDIRTAQNGGSPNVRKFGGQTALLKNDLVLPVLFNDSTPPLEGGWSAFRILHDFWSSILWCYYCR